MLKYIPNLFTSLNLCCGCIAAVCIVLNAPIGAVIFMFLGIFFDFFDGLAARALKVTSEVGVQLDSLADVITSGLVPGLMMIHIMSKMLLNYGIQGYFNVLFYEAKMPGMPDNFSNLWLPATGLLIVVASAYRLAKFNVDDRQTSGFIGLPTPANAIFIASLLIITEDFSPAWAYELLSNVWVLLGITVLSSLIMNSEIRLFALKFKSFGLKDNWYKYSFLLLSVAALILFKVIAVPFIILGYILFSIILNQTSKN